jgi:glutathione peroxidase-family protein
MDNNSKNDQVKISLKVDADLTGEEKVTYAELLNNVVVTILDSIFIVGIGGEKKALEAFQTGISYDGNTVSILLNPKNRFFHNELNNNKDIIELSKVAGIKFGFFSKIAVKGLAKFSSELESQMLERSRAAAAKNLIYRNTKLIISLIGESIYEELKKTNPGTTTKKTSYRM